jgi:RES domain-containing protein
VLTRLTDDGDLLEGIFELDNATNDRLLAESGLLPGIDARELVFGIPSYRIINAAFCHPAPNGSRFNSADRGAWYAGFELETSQSEVAYHKQLWLQETDWNEEEVAEYVDYRADFRAEFHDIRGTKKYQDCLSPTSYVASQALAAHLLDSGSAGIVYPSVRRTGGTCIACFRPVLVTNVQKGRRFTFVFADARTPPAIRPS